MTSQHEFQNSPRPARATLLPLLVAAAIALVAYYLWPRSNPPEAKTEPAAATNVEGAVTPIASGATPRAQLPGSSPGIQVDATGARILNEAGLPVGNGPLPTAKAIPIKAAPGEVIGYSTDAQGVSRPLRAGDLKVVPNSPGTYAVVDMWADGGYVVVPPTKPGPRMTDAELARARQRERDAAAARRN